MYIPDLFGAYTKGRELAIEKNWQDLKNYESVQGSRLANDLTALDLLGKRADFAGNRSMFQNQVDASNRANEVGEHAQRGMVAKADMGSDHAVNQYGIYKAYEPEMVQAMGNMYGAKIGEQLNAATALTGKNAYLAPYAYQIGQDQGYIGHQQVLANKTTASNLVNAAQQGINQSNANYANNMKGSQLMGMQLDSSITQQPLVHQNTMDALERVIPARDAAQAQISAGQGGAMSNVQIGSLISLAAQGDPGAVWQLKQAGYNADGSPLSAQPAPTTTAPAPTTTAPAPTTTAPVTATPATGQLVQQLLSQTQTQPTFNYPVNPAVGNYRPIMPAQKPDVWSNYQQAANYTGP